MKKVLQSFLLVLIVINLASCSKKKADYIGEYFFNNTQNIDIPNEYGISTYFSTKKITDKGKRLQILTPIELIIFKDDFDNEIKGEINFTRITKHNNGFRTTLKVKDIVYRIEKIYVKNDTLKFQIENEDANFSNEIFKGFVYKKKNKTQIGLHAELIGIEDNIKLNPWFITQKNESIIFKDNYDTILMKQFYSDQIDDINQKILDKNYKKQEKIILQNSIDYIKLNFLK